MGKKSRLKRERRLERELLEKTDEHRRNFLKYGAIAGVGLLTAGITGSIAYEFLRPQTQNPEKPPYPPPPPPPPPIYDLCSPEEYRLPKGLRCQLNLRADYKYILNRDLYDVDTCHTDELLLRQVDDTTAYFIVRDAHLLTLRRGSPNSCWYPGYVPQSFIKVEGELHDAQETGNLVPTHSTAEMAILKTNDPDWQIVDGRTYGKSVFDILEIVKIV